ncbi:MAG: hypothetical protein JXB04_08570, partial [Kiritimatiellae bacterium]|nr:hypothetical protein [Kiritimatiellia bacterium]
MRYPVRVAGAALVWLTTLSSRGAEVLQTFFAPFPENDLQVSLNMIDAFRGNIGAEMRTVISIVAGSDGTLLYFDHWEDGYEADISSPTQATTAVWGDGNAANGIPPGFSNDVVNAGTIVNLESTVDVQRNEVSFEYDGRDRIAVTKPIAMTRAMYAITPGEVLAEACGVFDVGSHGFEYRAPVGVGTGVGPYTNECFEYSAFHIMGDYNFTRIDIDKDNDGVFEITEYLDQGEPYFVNGGVLAGATVRGSKPFQCYLVTGDIRSTYEMRWYELWPTDQWDSDYFTPVGGVMDGASFYGTIIYVFNPNTNSITVEYRTLSSAGSFTVAAESVSDAFPMPTNSGGRFYTTDDSVFSAVQVFDVRSPGLVGECQDYDWGFTLMPVKALTTM